MDDGNGRDQMEPGDEAPPGEEAAGEQICPECSGSGSVDDRTCPESGGSGKVIAGIGGA
jgi:DnaJ-class molecular chaperone